MGTKWKEGDFGAGFGRKIEGGLQAFKRNNMWIPPGKQAKLNKFGKRQKRRITGVRWNERKIHDFLGNG